MMNFKEGLFTVFYICISSLILAFAVNNTITETNEYIDDIFEQMSSTIYKTGGFNAHNAEDIQAVVDSGNLHNVRETVDTDVTIYLYPERNEFGFNQGVFPETTPKGTLMGRGKPKQITLDNTGHFIILDRMWAFYDQRSIFNEHFFVNFKTDYVYLSQRLDNSKNLPLYSDSFVDNRFLTDDIDNIERQKEQNGYFFTRPYMNIYTGERVVTVLSPIVENGTLIADVGIHIPLSKLASTVSLYPKIKDKINLYIDFTYDDTDQEISTSKYDYLTIYKHKYEIKDLGELIATYDVTLVLVNHGTLIIVLIFLYFLLLANSRRYDRAFKEEEEILHQLSIDSMTQLYNRRGLDEILDKRSSSDYPIALLSIDANKFKRINDIHGHQIGDKALIFIAKAMIHCTKNKGYSIRMGGDEFLIVLPKTSLEQANVIGHSLDEYLSLFSKNFVGVSVQITWATILFEKEETFDEAYVRVDDLMYEKKYNTET